MNSQNVTKWIATLVVYILLLIFFIYFYLVDQMNDYFMDRTTVSSRLESVDILEPPTIVTCVRPRYKPSVSSQYGLKTGGPNSLIKRSSQFNTIDPKGNFRLEKRRKFLQNSPAGNRIRDPSLLRALCRF